MSFSISQEPSFVRSTFASIATRYDLANHVLSVGWDFLWRRRVARLVSNHCAGVAAPAQILDLATGSGDLALAIKRACPNAEVLGADFCPEMLAIARGKGIRTIEADALDMPFPAASFDALTVAFGLRNMVSYPHALDEMARVLRPGGLLVILDFSIPTSCLAVPYRFYLHHILPKLAGWLTGNPAAYRYLADSIEAFPRGQAMLDLLATAGFSSPTAQPQTFGIATLYTGIFS